MKQYSVTGMSCAACSSRIEKAVSRVPGVTACSVSLLTHSMGVEGTADPQAIISAVETAGYGASEQGSSSAKGSSIAADGEELLKDRETPILKQRLIYSAGFLIILMYFSMGHMMWNWPVPAFFSDNHVAMGLLQLLLTTAVMVINQKFFINGFKSLFHGSPNMDTLVALGSGASFVYSTYALFAMTGAQVQGDMESVMTYMHEFYFESAAMILTLITVGKMLEARSKGRTTNALKGLMKLAPKTATLVRDGAEVTVSIDQVQTGDIFVVRPGENIPVDGIVLEGASAVNESALTGESIPADKTAGDKVSAATSNQSGFLRCRATRVGEDTTLSQIIQMVSDAAATKAPIAKAADRVSGVFVPAVIAISIITTLVWLAAGQTLGFALARGISVLVISCPCALGLATPVAIMVGNGMGAKNGILFKTAVSLEETGKMQIVALDKTGTITEGQPKVTDLIPAEDYSEASLLSLAYALEAKSEHPLAKAILKRAEEEGMRPDPVEDFKALPGNGLSALRTKDHSALTGGSLAFINSHTPLSPSLTSRAKQLAEEGKTPLVFTENGRIAGIIAEEGKPCIIIVNKFDLFHPNASRKDRMAEVEEQVRRELFFINYAPFIATSAKKAEGVEIIFKVITRIRRESHNLPTTGQLNRLIQLAQQMNPPGAASGSARRLKIYYATTAVDPKYNTIPVPRYVLFVNDKSLLTDSYSQYLRNKIREAYPAPGIPVIFSARSRVRND